MKVKVIARAYYNDSIVNIGDVIDFEGKNMPSWATLLDGIESGKGRKNKKEEVKKDVKTPDYNRVKTGNGEGEKNTNDSAAEIEQALNETTEKLQTALENPETPIERVEYLNELISEGIEKNILIEDSDKKTVEEQIKELEEALKKENK